MAETTPIRAVEMVREIRDRFAREWADKSPSELVRILNEAGARAREEANLLHRDSTSNPRMEPTRR
jgi:hypothetical protein